MEKHTHCVQQNGVLVVAVETFCIDVPHNVAWVSKRKGRKTVGRFQHKLHRAAEKGNSQETFKVSVSSVFPKRFLSLQPCTTYIKDTKPSS